MSIKRHKKPTVFGTLTRLLAAALAGLAAGALFAPDAPRQRETASGEPLPLVPVAEPLPLMPAGTEQAPSEEAAGMGVIELDSPRLTVSIDGAPCAMELEEYLVGVVAGEMSAASYPEALKAQAVAARTFTALHMAGKAACKSGCTVCSDPFCCQAYLTDAELHARWGDAYPKYSEAIRSAVEETCGLVAVYGGELINALYHASSGHATESSEAVFANALPYLVSVDSPEGDSGAVSVQEFGAEEAAGRLAAAFPQSNIKGPLSEADIEVLRLTPSGRADRVRVGETEVSGMELRLALGLKSTAFTVEFTREGAVRFTCIGYGHGVGMSQLGANDMAAAGADFARILAHYYTGTELYLLKYADAPG